VLPLRACAKRLRSTRDRNMPRPPAYAYVADVAALCTVIAKVLDAVRARRGRCSSPELQRVQIIGKIADARQVRARPRTAPHRVLAPERAVREHVDPARRRYR
jgi:hypothetical protein